MSFENKSFTRFLEQYKHIYRAIQEKSNSLDPYRPVLGANKKAPCSVLANEKKTCDVVMATPGMGQARNYL